MHATTSAGKSLRFIKTSQTNVRGSDLTLGKRMTAVFLIVQNRAQAVARGP
ncbi:hypothetical protein PFLCHA0_c35940 [Pseudomonas protegens CHA0]|uniref:Uncharacterized protein n=1 Tax=Pseudomonas protegens (strain DSM 19095 / LMG 27888 / CFBP 6595 / CHA0) TaxID=1124983 RepID=A0A2C9ENW2_PSEPH|nr:hypothetical protein PFLCHA0_c35940 [Pseudomonas protegens CHA0]